MDDSSRSEQTPNPPDSSPAPPLPRSPAPGQWLELSTAAEPEAVDAVAEVFQRWGQGVAIEEPVVSSPDGDAVYVDRERPVVVKTYLPVDERVEERRERLEEAIWHLGRLRRVEPLQVRRLIEDEWAHAWKRYFFVQKIGQRMVIVPSWRRYSARPDDVVLRLDPGMAFGTGLHPTTRLCLASLERWVEPGLSVLDLGTGSGILAVAAVKLGAGAVLALDIEPVAVRVARENARRNRVARKIAVRLGSLPLEEPARSFGLVVANISIRVILELLREVCAALVPDGLAIFSGVLAEAQEKLLARLSEQGFEMLELRQEGDWIAVVARRSASAPETSARP